MMINLLDKSGFILAVNTIWEKVLNKIDSLPKVARSGNYIDLTNKPTIPDAVRVKGNAETTYRTGDVNLTPEDIGAVSTVASQGLSDTEKANAIANIGAASEDELTSCWNKFLFASIGWYRIAEIVASTSDSCSISLKRVYSNTNSECHKVELIDTYSSSVFKSIYDKANSVSDRIITKIRIVKSGNNKYIDVYYNASIPRRGCVVIENGRNSEGVLWSILDAKIAPETTTGETVLAEMEFEANSWIPDKADINNAWSLSGGTAIPANADLDDYKEVDNYYCMSDAVTLTLNNCPVNGAFTMKVFKPEGNTGLIGQYVFKYSDNFRWYRYYMPNQNAWSGWNRVDNPLLNNLTTTEAGKGALDAYQGYLLSKNTKTLTSFTEIPSGADLKSDTYLVPGNYACIYDSTAGTLSNCPFTESFTMTVSYAAGHPNFIKQIFEKIDGGKRVERTKVINSNSWFPEYTYTGTST